MGAYENLTNRPVLGEQLYRMFPAVKTTER
jgi:hypothetical protein